MSRDLFERQLSTFRRQTDSPAGDDDTLRRVLRTQRRRRRRKPIVVGALSMGVVLAIVGSRVSMMTPITTVTTPIATLDAPLTSTATSTGTQSPTATPTPTANTTPSSSTPHLNPPPLRGGGGFATQHAARVVKDAPLDPQDDLFEKARHAHELALTDKELAGWERYLDRYPNGRFAPEARFRDALALAKLGRDGEALETFRWFVQGGRDYRRSEAMRWIQALSAEE
jgi:hypothetical protein